MARRGATRVVVPDYAGLAAYREAGGYRLLRQVRDGTPSPDAIIAIMQDAGLKGLGGAGFPAGGKWSVVHSPPGPRLLSVNGGAGAPGPFKARPYTATAPPRHRGGAL